ncbi:MAG: M48 family metallopeptidase [Gammaproteobacteria bacterium]|uniref:M48 family metallopeptidase n=1 Tax=Limnobacter sp. TaxID=2003368 RepID=UPI001D4A33AE|nr:M48 family metallopeptidase [Gammaproteobacteria bacterium]MBU0849426.1 M48 family metallopeptidase [Gammaproteobacteria bacterium]MBU1266577.1 M48 family metallopeptidase [Gammaproteobacteria bacterium]MBU1527774.1 M48 family metallopeptidase [Gammaproteobacteria bacterium]MBU1779553.1 M48 family metallopeptidase [Gammaproteobacteria bacterium]
MKKRDFLKLAAIASGMSSVAPTAMALDFGKMLGAGADLAKSANISDEELSAYFDQMTVQYDKQHKIADEKTPYGKRLQTLVKGLETEDGLKLNFKVYETPEVNAFAMANGTIRVYSGLMDMMSDEEIRYVIGHEVGHVKAGHTKARIQTAMRTSALRQAASATGGNAGLLAESQLGDLFEKVISAQHSQGNENEADDYAMAFMKRRNYDAKAAVSALEKLAKLSEGSSASWLSTHPAPSARAQRMKSQLG